MGLRELPDGSPRLSIMTDAEQRIVLLHYYLEQKKYFPWMWDFDNYGEEENRDMIGFFYPEDLANLNMIDGMIATYQYEQQRLHNPMRGKK